MMSWRLRPSFRQEFPSPRDETQQSIVARISQHHPAFELKSHSGFLCIRIPHEQRHFWTPRLNVSLEPNEAGGTTVQGTFGPNANVWALYLYGYLIVGLVGLFSGMFGASQLYVGIPPWGLWIFGSSLVLALAMYLASRVGQRIALPQTKMLENVYSNASGQPIRIH